MMDRPSRAVGFVPVTRDDQRWPPVAFHHPRRRNANHAAMPALVVEHHAVGFAQRGFFFQTTFDARHDATFFFLPLGVQLVKPPGDLAGALHIFLVKQIHHVASHIHASGGVQARSDAEGNLGRRQRAPSPSFATSSSAFRPTLTGRRSPAIQLREHAILAQQGDCIGDGGDGHNFHERHQQARLIFCIQPALHQSLRQLEGHARAAQMLAGIVATF